MVGSPAVIALADNIEPLRGDDILAVIGYARA
jgi:hypothetical protein